MSPNYAMVAGRAGHRCEYCQAPEAVFNFPFEVEHVVPRALDGSNEIDNLALSCRSCNLHKAATLTATDAESDCEVALFHPRNHHWSDCFAVDLKTGQIRRQELDGPGYRECIGHEFTATNRRATVVDSLRSLSLVVQL